MRIKIGLLTLTTISCVYSKVYFREDFNDDGWKDRWVISKWKDESEIGTWNHTAGEWYADEGDKGIKTGNDAHFYAISAKMDDVLNNEDKNLAISFTVKHEQTIDCGGAYIKLLPSGLDQDKFSGESPYSIMFGPDICGHSTKKTHAILNYARPKGDTSSKNMDHNSEIKCETDYNTHIYTFIIKPDGTYDVKIDGLSVQSGKLSDNWPFRPQKEINDPTKSKPKDWVDEKKIPDPNAKKPADWEDIPKQIPDPDAKKPEDWDDDDDGEWEPPMIDNEKYKGEWRPEMIDNPDYIGEWDHPKIPNPDYFEDNMMHARCKDCEYVGFELWQVKSGTLFDDILVTDDLKEIENHEQQVLEKMKKIREVKKVQEEIEKEKLEAEMKKEEEEDRKEEEEDRILEEERKKKEELEDALMEETEDDDEDEEEPTDKDEL